MKSLLDFDRNLSSFGTEEEKSKEIKTPRLISSAVSDQYKLLDREMESQIIDALKKNNIPFEKELKGKRFSYDIVVPDSKNPKILIDIRVFQSKYVSSMLLMDRLINMAVFSKRDYPQSKFILFMNNKENFLTPFKEEMLKYDVDKIFDLKEMNEFITYLKKELKIN